MVVRVPMADVEKEQELAERGTYELVIRRFEKRKSQAGNTWFQVTFGFTNGEHPTFREGLFPPNEDDDAERAASKVRRFVRLLKLFDIPYDPEEAMDEFEPTEEDCIGATADCPVYIGTETDENDEEYEVNRISLAAPRRKKESRG